MKRAGEVEERKYGTTMKFVHNFVDTRHGQLAEVADAVKSLIVDCDAQAAGFLRDHHDGAAVPRGRVLDQASCKIFIQDSIHLFCNERVHPIRLGANWNGARRQIDLEGQQRACPEIGRGLGEDISKVVEHVGQVVNHRWCPTVPMEVERDISHVRGKAAPQRQEACALLNVKTFEKSRRRFRRWRRFLFCSR